MFDLKDNMPRTNEHRHVSTEAETLTITTRSLTNPGMLLERVANAIARNGETVFVKVTDRRAAKTVSHLLESPVREWTDDGAVLYNTSSSIQTPNDTIPVTATEKPLHWRRSGSELKLQTGDEVIAKGSANSDPSSIAADLPQWDPDEGVVTANGEEVATKRVLRGEFQRIDRPHLPKHAHYLDGVAVLTCSDGVVTQHFCDPGSGETKPPRAHRREAVSRFVERATTQDADSTIDWETLVARVQAYYHGLTGHALSKAEVAEELTPLIDRKKQIGQMNGVVRNRAWVFEA